jgi:hypothetical protein
MDQGQRNYQKRSTVNAIKLRIAWGRDKDEVKLYVFETEEQKAFFLEGVEAAAGWLEYEIKD